MILNFSSAVHKRSSTEKYIKRYEKAQNVLQKREKTLPVTGRWKEEFIWSIASRELPKRLYSGKTKLRYQQGLADTFITAAKRAQNYLPYVEREFRLQGAPIELTRLLSLNQCLTQKPFLRWEHLECGNSCQLQLKSYMKVNSKIDERNSPLKAARAAAKLLTGNYESLKAGHLRLQHTTTAELG